jgi:serine protease Do
MIYSRTGGYMGVSFAIPIEVALDISRQLRETGKVTRGRLGVGIQPVTKELAESFKLDSAEGVIVVNVEPGAPADKAGLQVGDVIVSYNDELIDEANELPRLVAGTRPGEQARIGVSRQGERRRPGDVIVAVNASRFRSLEEFNNLIAAHTKGERVALLVRRGEAALYVPVEVG